MLKSVLSQKVCQSILTGKKFVFGSKWINVEWKFMHTFVNWFWYLASKAFFNHKMSLEFNAIAFILIKNYGNVQLWNTKTTFISQIATDMFGKIGSLKNIHIKQHKVLIFLPKPSCNIIPNSMFAVTETNKYIQKFTIKIYNVH